jgi:7-cyano-7-deazaguanine synthase
MSAVVITSGGMDSTTAVYWAKHYFGSIECMSFDYGQRHRKELECAKKIAYDIDVEHTIVDLTGITHLIATSALTNPDIEVPEGHYAEESMKATVVPNRNAMMLNIGIARAVAIGAESVVVGVHAGDHAIYPDCREEFISLQERTAKVANEGFIHPEFQLAAPFVNMTKAQIADLGDQLGVPWHETWTCYKGGGIHCGRCSTCVERLEAFHLAGVPDRTEYEDTTYWRTALEQFDG